MDPITLGIISSIATGYFTHFTAPVVEGFFRKAIEIKPELEKKLQNARSTEDLEEIFKDASGVIEASANTGDIKVMSGVLEAVRGIRFNHDDGTVLIQGTTMKAPVLVTGGGVNSTGTTTIGRNTEMSTNGTKVSVGEGASIHISGDAQIRQG